MVKKSTRVAAVSSRRFRSVSFFAAGGRFPIGDLVPYVIAQVVGAIAAAGVLYLIASGKTGFDASVGFASCITNVNGTET